MVNDNESQENLDLLHAQLARINDTLDKKLYQQKEFWLNQMREAKTEETLTLWYNAMMQETIKILSHYPIDDIDAEWSHDAEKVYREHLPHTIRSKSFMHNYTWPAMGLAIACVSMAAIASPVLAAASVIVGGCSVGYATLDTLFRTRTLFTKNKSPNISEGEKNTNRLNFASSMGALAIGGLILGVTLTSVFPPVGILVLASVVTLPFVAKIGIHAMQSLLRQTELTKAQQQSQNTLRLLKNTIDLKNQINAEENKEKLHQASSLLKDAEAKITNDDDYIKHLNDELRALPTPKPAPSHPKKELENAADEEENINAFEPH